MRALWCALLLLSMAACRGVEGRAAKLIEEGELAAADALLVQEVQDHPTNLEAHFLLGKTRLLLARPNDAARAFAIVTPDEEYAKRVAEEYWRAASSDEPELAGRYLSYVAELDRDRALAACVHGLALARRLVAEEEDVSKLLEATAAIDTRCRRKTIVFIEWTLRDASSASDARVARKLARIALEADRDSAELLAEALRDRAIDIVKEDRGNALSLVEHAEYLHRPIANEPRTLALKAHFVAIPSSAPPTSYARPTDPLTATLLALDRVGGALFTYVFFFRELPPADDIRELERHLARYLNGPMPVDGWGRSLTYVSDGWQARLISRGSDGSLTPQSTDLTVPGRGMLDAGGADIIWEDGAIVQRPAADPPAWMAR